MTDVRFCFGCCAVLALFGAACKPRIAPSIKDITAIEEQPGRYRLAAEVRGRTDGLEFLFLSRRGTIDHPQKNQRTAILNVPPATTEDQIAVELIRQGQRIDIKKKVFAVKPPLETETPGSAETVFLAAPVTSQLLAKPQLVPPRAARQLAIRITSIPHYDPFGGSETKADIAGLVEGPESTVWADFRVVLYARTDFWYVQPEMGATVAIAPDGRWRHWTHTGRAYAALLVKARHEPQAILVQLPEAGADVVRVAVEAGVK